MQKTNKAQDSITLDISSVMKLVDSLELSEDSGKITYKTRGMLKMYMYMLIKQITGFQTMAKKLKSNPELWYIFGFKNCPHRTTFSRRFKALPEIVREQIRELHSEFVAEERTVAEVVSTDSSIMAAQGNVWHQKQREQGILPSCGNIDQEAHWGVNGCGQWTYGYRIHCLVTGTASTALPCDVEVAAANIKDAHVFQQDLVDSLPETTQVVFADKGYAQQTCYDACDAKQVSLIAPIDVKKNTPPERQVHAELYHDPEVREAFSTRKSTVEPFQGQLKSLFNLDKLPVKGLANVRPLVMLSTLAYLLIAKLNCLLGRDMLKIHDTLIAIR